MQDTTTDSGLALIDKHELACIKLALQEDLADGDVTARLIPASQPLSARVISRDSAVLCGIDWFNSVYAMLDPYVTIHWHAADGDHIQPDQLLCELAGSARSILSAERTALNYLQTLSGTATRTQHYSSVIEDLPTRLLDTRKTIPTLRAAQKYAVTCGGGYNHRSGLYDAILIKENHIAAAGSITNVLQAALKMNTGLLIEIEVENLAQMNEAIQAGAKRLLLDNFTPSELCEAVKLKPENVALEASGGITLKNLRAMAETGVDYRHRDTYSALQLSD